MHPGANYSNIWLIFDLGLKRCFVDGLFFSIGFRCFFDLHEIKVLWSRQHSHVILESSSPLYHAFVTLLQLPNSLLCIMPLNAKLIKVWATRLWIIMQISDKWSHEFECFIYPHKQVTMRTTNVQFVWILNVDRLCNGLHFFHQGVIQSIIK